MRLSNFRHAIIWVDRVASIWFLQVQSAMLLNPAIISYNLVFFLKTTVAIICLVEALLLAYLSYKGNIIRTIVSFHFILEIVNNASFIPTVSGHYIKFNFSSKCQSGTWKGVTHWPIILLIKAKVSSDFFNKIFILFDSMLASRCMYTPK